MNEVKLIRCTSAEFSALGVKSNDTLYFLTDTNEIFRGDTLQSLSVMQMDDGGSAWRPLLLGADGNASAGQGHDIVGDKVYSAIGVEVQPSTGTVKATTFKGSLDGNATSATNATNATNAANATKAYSMKIDHRNEICIDANGQAYFTGSSTGGAVWFGYRLNHRGANSKITEYRFGNGAGAYTDIRANNFWGNATTATTATKLGTTTVGNNTTPIFLNSGSPTAMTSYTTWSQFANGLAPTNAGFAACSGARSGCNSGILRKPYVTFLAVNPKKFTCGGVECYFHSSNGYGANVSPIEITVDGNTLYVPSHSSWNFKFFIVKKSEYPDIVTINGVSERFYADIAGYRAISDNAKIEDLGEYIAYCACTFSAIESPRITPFTAYVSMATDNYQVDGSGAVAIGSNSLSLGRNSVSLMYNANSIGRNSISSGYSSVASGYSSVASGYSSVASGECSFAAGRNSIASAQSAVALGAYTKASTSYQTVVGRYNKETNSLFIVGNGTSESSRQNVFEVGSDGSIYLYKNNVKYKLDMDAMINSGLIKQA